LVIFCLCLASGKKKVLAWPNGKWQRRSAQETDPKIWHGFTWKSSSRRNAKAPLVEFIVINGSLVVLHTHRPNRISLIWRAQNIALTKLTLTARQSEMQSDGDSRLHSLGLAARLIWRAQKIGSPAFCNRDVKHYYSDHKVASSTKPLNNPTGRYLNLFLSKTPLKRESGACLAYFNNAQMAVRDTLDTIYKYIEERTNIWRIQLRHRDKIVARSTENINTAEILS